MFFCETGSMLRRLLPYLFGIITGVIAGVMLQQHFLYAHLLYHVSVGTALLAWAVCLVLVRREHSGSCQRKCGPGDFFGGNFALLLCGTVGMVSADAHNTRHAVLFGLTAALLVFVFLRAVFYSRE